MERVFVGFEMEWSGHLEVGAVVGLVDEEDFIHRSESQGGVVQKNLRVLEVQTRRLKLGKGGKMGLEWGGGG